MNIYYGLFILAVVVVMHNASHVFLCVLGLYAHSSAKLLNNIDKNDG